MVIKRQTLLQICFLFLVFSSVSLDGFSLNHCYLEDKSPTTAFSTRRSGHKNDNIEWEVYVDQSEIAVACGSTATHDAFVGLVPPSVKVHPCIISTSSRSKSPIVRCSSRTNPDKCLEITNVDSVDKVYRLLTHHMKVQGVDANACECIKWKHKGNRSLDRKEIDLAIEAYDNALKINCVQQEANILMKRASAYQQRASSHKIELKKLVLELTCSVVDKNKLYKLYEQASKNPALVPAILKKIESYTKTQEATFKGVKFRDGLYQYAILHAVQDALRATQLIPHSERSWLIAAECLSKLYKLPESIQYYQRAAELKPAFNEKIKPEMSRLQGIQQLLDNAKSYGWSRDMLRVALTVVEADD